MCLAKMSLHDFPGNNFEPNESKITKPVINPHVIDSKILALIWNHNLI